MADSLRKPNPRVPAIDIARALAVIGVVFNHTMDGLTSAHLIGPGHPLSVINDALYVFRMPALAFLMGVFIPGALAKRGFGRYLTERATLMLWLYLLWFVLQGVVQLLTNGVRNTPTRVEQLLHPWAPIAHLWFLPFLVAATAIVAAVRPWRLRPLPLIGLVLVLGYTVVAWGWNPNIVGIRGLSLVGFVALGSVVGLPRLRAAMVRPLRLWLPAGVVAAVAFVALTRLPLVPATLKSDAPLTTHLLSAVAACLGLVALLAAAVLLQHLGRAFTWLEAVGRQTLPIYLAHVVVAAGLRIALVRAGVREPYLFAVVCVVLGVAVPLLAARLAPRLHLGWVFDTPAWLRRLVLPERTAPAALAATRPVAEARPAVPRRD